MTAWALCTDIEKRSQNSYTATCNGNTASSAMMELQLGVFRFFSDHTHRKQMQTKCVHNLRVPCSISRVFIFTLRQQHIRIWRIKVILIAGKTRIPPIGAPCRDKDGASTGISGLNLWLYARNQNPCLSVPVEKQIFLPNKSLTHHVVSFCQHFCYRIVIPVHWWLGCKLAL